MAVAQAQAFADSLKSDECIKIYAGSQTPTSRPYVVSKSILSQSSRYFSTALSSRFKEGQQGILHLPEDNEQTWSLFLFWLFRGEVSKLHTRDSFHSDHYWLALAHAYVFGDKYELPKFQNAIARAFMGSLETCCIKMSGMKLIFDLLSPDCPLWKLMVEEIVVLATCGLTGWKDADEFVVYEGFFLYLMECLDKVGRDVNAYPPHMYGKNEVEVWRYLVDEGEGKGEVDLRGECGVGFIGLWQG